MTAPSGPSHPVARASRCANHPQREGIGICVGCRAVVCVECATKIDRMNYCIRCLEAAAPAGAARREDPRAENALGFVLLLVSFFISVGAFAALGYVLAVLRRAGSGGMPGG